MAWCSSSSSDRFRSSPSAESVLSTKPVRRAYVADSREIVWPQSARRILPRFSICMIVYMPGELGALLREGRIHADLRQCEVAELAEADQSMISLYERGQREPTWPTFLRLLSAADAVAEVRVANLDGQHLTLENLARHLTESESDSTRRRLVLDFVGRYRDADAGRRFGLLLGQPESTGDVRWDALLGGLAEHFAFHDAVDPPAWINEHCRFLDYPWYWVDLPSVRRRALLGTPSAFRRRNVWIDRVDLERV